MRPTEPSRLRYFCGRCIGVIILYVCNVIREMPISFPILLVRSPFPGSRFSRCVTSGRDLTASVGKKWVVEVEALYFGEAWLHVMSSSLDGMGEWFCNTLIHKVLAFSYGVKPPIRKLLAPDYQLLTISPSSVAVNQFDIFRGWDASDGMLKSRYCHQQSILKGEHIIWNNRGKNW